jgi:hypothetical protein
LVLFFSQKQPLLLDYNGIYVNWEKKKLWENIKSLAIHYIFVSVPWQDQPWGSVAFFVFSSFRWEVIVHFVDIFWQWLSLFQLSFHNEYAKSCYIIMSYILYKIMNVVELSIPVYITITCTLKRKLPRYSWNIVESGVKHHNTSLKRTGQI